MFNLLEGISFPKKGTVDEVENAGDILVFLYEIGNFLNPDS